MFNPSIGRGDAKNGQSMCGVWGTAVCQSDSEAMCRMLYGKEGHSKSGKTKTKM